MNRREELQRERNLVASHLAWLDLELARFDGTAPQVSSAATQPQPSAPTPGPAPVPTPRNVPDAAEQALTEQLLQEQMDNTSKSVGEVKRGCFLLFAAALLLLGAIVFLGYWFKYRH